MRKTLRNNRGFTFIEMLMVFVVLGILAQMSLIFVLDLKSRSYDVTAITDGRNFVTKVRDNLVNRDDVDYTHQVGDGPDIGTADTGGGARLPVFTMSPGVEAEISGCTNPEDPGLGCNPATVVATFHHTRGTEEATGSGRREYNFVIEEFGNDVLATF